jgi:hypothetical protein
LSLSKGRAYFDEAFDKLRLNGEWRVAGSGVVVARELTPTPVRLELVERPREV